MVKMVNHKELSEMNVGDHITCKIGHLIEIHRVPLGWIYIFAVSPGGTNRNTQFVPEALKLINYAGADA